MAPLAGGHDSARDSLRLTVGDPGERGSDPCVAPPCGGVLVTQRGAGRGMSEPNHQFTLHGEHRAGATEVVELGPPGRGVLPCPAERSFEHVGGQLRLPVEGGTHQPSRPPAGVLQQVLRDSGYQVGRDGDHRTPASDLGTVNLDGHEHAVDSYHGCMCDMGYSLRDFPTRTS